jgi:CheY-like chemotaxis protein
VKILVADDDPTFVRLFTETFAKRGWAVVSAVDAMQALMVTQRDPGIDLILLDIGMPGGTGLRTLERLKASSKTIGIPVIVVTGSDDPEMPEKVKALGAAACLRKPVDPNALADKIERAAVRRPSNGS